MMPLPNSSTIDRLVISPSLRVLRSPHPRLRTVAIASALLALLLSISLLASFLAFIALYRSYIPTVGHHAPLELQYGYGRPPYAIVPLDKLAIATGQVYDVFIEIVVPPSSTNFEMGNFMVDLDLQTSTGTSAVKATKSVSRAHSAPRPSPRIR